jgi:membrane protein implicated in regulation of membrane protease activity
MASVVWFVVAVVLGVIELLGTTFILLWIAVAAAVTGVISLFAPSFGVELTIFVVLSILLLIVTRPLVRRWRGGSPGTYQSNVEQLVGEQGIVVQRVASEKSGVVRVGSQTWSAITESSDGPIERDELIVVEEARSSILLVRRATRPVP